MMNAAPFATAPVSGMAAPALKSGSAASATRPTTANRFIEPSGALSRGEFRAATERARQRKARLRGRASGAAETLTIRTLSREGSRSQFGRSSWLRPQFAAVTVAGQRRHHTGFLRLPGTHLRRASRDPEPYEIVEFDFAPGGTRRQGPAGR